MTEASTSGTELGRKESEGDRTERSQAPHGSAILSDGRQNWSEKGLASRPGQDCMKDLSFLNFASR
jgi:hypothetical protein